jgi:hypothetical protein
VSAVLRVCVCVQDAAVAIGISECAHLSAQKSHSQLSFLQRNRHQMRGAEQKTSASRQRVRTFGTCRNFSQRADFAGRNAVFFSRARTALCECVCVYDALAPQRRN